MGRHAALGLSVMLEAPGHAEPESLLESARAFFDKGFGTSPISSVGLEAAILIMLQNGSAEDRDKAFESLPRSEQTTKYEAIRLMDTRKHADLRALGTMLNDPKPYISQSAADKLYSSLTTLGTEGFDVIAPQLSEAIIPRLLSTDKSENKASLDKHAGLLVAAAMYASPKSLEGYFSGVKSLLDSEDPLAFGAGYSIAEKLLARSLIQKSALPERYMYKTKDLEFFSGAYLASAKSIGMPLTTREIYDAYLENIERMFSEGIISKGYYKKKLKLRTDFERRQKAAANSAAMMFGVFNAGFPSNGNGRGEKYAKDVSAIEVEEYELFKNAIDGIIISEKNWQAWLHNRLEKASTLKNPHAAYWKMLRLEAKAHKKATKEAYGISKISGVFEDSVLGYMKMLSLYSVMDDVDNRLYLMHETDLNSRVGAMKQFAEKISENNGKLIEEVSAYCQKHGVAPSEEYIKEYEALASSNIAMIKKLEKQYEQEANQDKDGGHERAPHA